MEARNNEHVRVPWYRVPVLWLGILIFAGSIAGCVWLIVVSSGYRDEALEVPSQSVFGVPAQRHPPPARS